MKENLFKIAYNSRMMVSSKEIEQFEYAIENLLNESIEVSMIKNLCELLDDNTEHVEVMFNVIHYIEYIYIQNKNEGINELINILPDVMEDAFDWIIIILGRLLSVEEYIKIFIDRSKFLSIDKKIKISYVLVKIKEDNDDKDILNDIDNILRNIW